jgi:hypothetical protein
MNTCACSGDGRATLQLDRVDAHRGKAVVWVARSMLHETLTAVEKASLPVQLLPVPPSPPPSSNTESKR